MGDRRYRGDRDEDDDDFQPEDRSSRRGREVRKPDVRQTAQDAVRRANSRGGRRDSTPLSGISKPAVLIAALVSGVVVLAIVLYFLLGQSPGPAAPQTPAQAPARTTAPEAGTQPAPGPVVTGKESFLESLMGGDSPAPAGERTESWPATIARILLKLALGALLAAMLAFRPRKDLPATHRNPYVGQTQILLAVVAAALMMVVADNAARAFGIFAAASLVRFRTNIHDPKEITVLLVSLAIGLASGVGKFEVAIILALFVMLMLIVLEYYEPAQVFRSLELTVTTRNVMDTDEVLKEIFEKYQFTAELREVDRQDPEDPIGKIVYHVNMSPRVSTDELSEEIFTYDRDNVDSIQWDQKKSTSYIYK